MTTRFTCFFLCVTSYLLSLSAGLAQSTSTPWGTWFIGTLQLPGGPKKWGGFMELQARSNDLFNRYFYNELKGGISYDLDKNFTVMMAGGRYATYDYKELSAGPLSVEKRVWQQLIINQYLSRLKFEHRYRIEQRWFDLRDGSSQFRNRIRYRINAFLPLNKLTISQQTVFLSVYNEIFINPKGPAFERNRFYAGIGYQTSKNLILQLGWVNQINYSPATYNQGVYIPLTSSGKNNLVLSATYRLNRRNSKPGERLPSQQD